MAKFFAADNRKIYLVFGKDKSQDDCYFFIKAKESDYDILKRGFNKRSLDLTKYAEVIASGFGLEPSEEIKTMLKEKYNFDADRLQ